MKCVDDNGNLVDRYQRIFVRPLVSECSQVDSSLLTLPPAMTGGAPPAQGNDNSTDNSTVPVDNSTDNSTGTDNSTSNDTGILNGTIGEVNDTINNATDDANSTLANLTTNTQEVVNNGTDVAVDNSTDVIIDNSTDVVNGTDTNGTDTNGTQTNGTDNNGTEVPPATGGNMIQCCDYFTSGIGYEFSVCDGIGAIIRGDLIGGERDAFYGS